MSLTAKLLSQLSGEVKRHNDRCSGKVIAFGFAWVDMERLQLDEGEEILPGICATCDGKNTGSVRVICDANEQEKNEIVEAISNREPLTV